jgi:uncharacterized protein DUF5753
VATLLTAWRIPTGEREEVLPDILVEVGTLASYENDANELVDVSLVAIPGLLHTYETALGVMQAAGLTDRDVETNWMARLRRQQILGKVDYTAYIGQGALQAPFGGRQALRGQLQHLLGAQDRAIRVRIIPAHQTRVLILHSWLWMSFPHTKPVVNVELSVGAFYIHDQDVDPYTEMLSDLDRTALSQADSRKLINDLMEGL